MQHSSKQHRRQRWAANLLAGACVCVATPGRPAFVDWTGNAPVYLATWSDGQSVQTREFQHLLDWQGFCNAHAGSNCEQRSFWGSSRNWSNLLSPGQYDDVRVAAGSTVWISQFNSAFQGPLSGFAQAATLSAGEATINIGLSSMLTIGDGAVGRLGLTLGSKLVSNGQFFVDNLTASEGQFTGSGKTVVRGISASSFSSVIGGGHNLELAGDYSGAIELKLSGQSHFVNTGALSATGSVRLDGGLPVDLFYIPNTFTNLGSIKEAITISGLRFDNSGVVDIATGVFVASGAGAHIGSFIGGSASTLLFDGIGASVMTHHFLPGSSIDSKGRVVFGHAGHLIEGSYNVAETVIGTTSADVTFAGREATLGKVAVQASSNVHFRTGGAALKIEALSTEGQFGFAFFYGAASSIGSVTINGGGINSASGLTITDSLSWRSGALGGAVTTPGSSSFVAGVRDFAGTILNTGKAVWQAGNFSKWGIYDNQAGGSFDIQGDHSVSSSTGRFDNAGTLKKSTGTGRANWALQVNNSGAVEVLSGTLALQGGGRHNGSLAAAPGALLELAGAQTITGAVTTSGRVDVTGGVFTVLPGGNYTNAAGNILRMARFDNRLGGSFANDGVFDNKVLDGVSNSGKLNNRAGARLTTLSLDNSGSIDNAAELTVNGGGLRNTGALINSATFMVLGELTNSGSIFNTGNATLSGGSNAGDITNSGSLVNKGEFANDGNIANRGSFTNRGFLTVGAAGRITGTGSFLQTSGDTVVNGLLQALGGIDIQAGSLSGTGTVVGDIVAGVYTLLAPGNSPGTLTIQGNLALNGAFYSLGPNLQIEIADRSAYDRLLVSGSATFNDAMVELAFTRPAQLRDGDSYTWLTADSIADNGMRLQIAGLPSAWSSQVSNTGKTMRLTVFDEPEVSYESRISRRGSLQIAPGEVTSHWAGELASLNALDNAGTLVNLERAALYTRSLINQAGGTIINRGLLNVDCCFGEASNAGLLRNRAGAEMQFHSPLNNTGRLINHGTVTLKYGMTNAAGGLVETYGEMTNLGSSYLPIDNRGTFVVGGRLNNSGSIRNEGGGVFTVLHGAEVSGPGGYSQAQSITHVDGVLKAASLSFVNGQLTGSGSLVGRVTMSSVLVSPGNSPGLLTIDGSLTAISSTFEIELAGAALADQLHVTGSATINDGRIQFYLSDGYRPQIGDHFQWLLADGGVSFQETMGWRIFTSAIGDEYLVPWQPPLGMEVAMQGGLLMFTATPVPEPGTWLMMLAGLAGLLLRRKRSPKALAQGGLSGLGWIGLLGISLTLPAHAACDSADRVVPISIDFRSRIYVGEVHTNTRAAGCHDTLPLVIKAGGTLINRGGFFNELGGGQETQTHSFSPKGPSVLLLNTH